MAKTIARDEDYLGLVALGSVISVIGNVMQASDRQKLKVSYDQLKAGYEHLVQRYKALYQEYTSYRQLNATLQQEVVSLRTENNKLLEQLAKKEGGQ